jgi:hypothetical protein
MKQLLIDNSSVVNYHKNTFLTHIFKHMGRSMNNMQVLLLSSALSIGSLVMGSDFASTSTSSSTSSTDTSSVEELDIASSEPPRSRAVLFSVYRDCIEEKNNIFSVPFYVYEDDKRDFAEVENFMNDWVLKRNELNMRGQFYVLSKRFVICPKRSSKIADLNQYKPYTLAFVAQNL